MRLMTLVVLMTTMLLAWASSASAQLVMQETYPRDSKIVIRCEVPTVQMGTAKVLWSYDEEMFTELGKDDKGNDALLVWAGPGKHWIEATIVITRWIELETIKRHSDPKFRDDITKATIELKKFEAGSESRKYRGTFTVPENGKAPPRDSPKEQPKDPLVPLPPAEPPTYEPPVTTPPTTDTGEILFGLDSKVRDRVLLMKGATLQDIAAIAMNYRKAADMIASGTSIDEVMGKVTIDAAGKKKVLVESKLGLMHSDVLKTQQQLAAWDSFWPWLDEEVRQLKQRGNRDGVKLDPKNKKHTAIYLLEVYYGIADAGAQRP